MSHHRPPRRRFLRHVLAGTSGIAAALPLARPLHAAVADSRQLDLAHTHTGERLSLVYAQSQQYLPDALDSLNHFLRDHYSGTIGDMDPRLYDLLHAVHRLTGARRPYEVISGYRAPATNDTLRRSRGGGVAKHSLHMEGRAADVRLPGVRLSDLRDAALSLQAGGVGYYPDQDFVHVDTGRVRRW